MTQATIGQQVLPILSLTDMSLFVTNLGPGRVYYSKDSSVTPSSGMPLDPGNSVQGWPVGQSMYVVCASGTATVSYENNGSTVAVGTTTAVLPSGTTVNVGNTVPVSGNVGVSGSVDASGSTVGLANGTTVKTANMAVTLANRTTNLGNIPHSINATPTTLWDSSASGGTDLSPYSTLAMQFSNYANSATVDVTGNFIVYVNQYTTGGTLVRSEQPQFLASGYMRYVTQIVAPVVKVLIGGDATAALPAMTLTGGFNIVGLSATLPHSYFQSPGVSRTQSLTGVTEAAFALGGQTTLQATAAASSSAGYWFPETWAGPGTYAWRATQSGATAVAMVIQNASAQITGDLFTSTPITLGGSSRAETGAINFPETPIAVNVNNTDTGTRGVAIGFMYTH